VEVTQGTRVTRWEEQLKEEDVYMGMVVAAWLRECGR
jgi:hypothetical protein